MIDNPMPSPCGHGLGFEQHRVICCHKATKEPYLVCCGAVSRKTHEGGHPYGLPVSGRWSYYDVFLCGNLMHPSCIKRFGPCCEDAETIEYVSPKEGSHRAYNPSPC